MYDYYFFTSNVLSLCYSGVNLAASGIENIHPKENYLKMMVSQQYVSKQ